MPVNHDYECGRCKRIFEAMVRPEQKLLLCPYCHGRAERVYLKFGQMLGKSKGLYPYFDVQAGQTFESSTDRDNYAAKRGRFENRDGPKMEIMGPEEFDRSRHAPRTPNPADSDEVEPWMIETAKRVWDDMKYDRLPKEVEEDRVKKVIEADILDVKDAPVIKGA